MSWSKPRRLRPARLCDGGSDEHSMSSNTRRSWKRRAPFPPSYAALRRNTKHRRRQKPTMPIVAKWRGTARTSQTFHEEYSLGGSTTEGVERSEGAVEARSAALWGHWVTDVRRGAGSTATGWESLRRQKSPEGALSAPINRRQRGNGLGPVFA